MVFPLLEHIPANSVFEIFYVVRSDSFWLAGLKKKDLVSKLKSNKEVNTRCLILGISLGTCLPNCKL